MALWPSKRASEINDKLRGRLASKGEITFTFVIGKDDTAIRYFSTRLTDDLRTFSPGPFRFVEPDSSERPDLVILTVHGQDISERIWGIYSAFGEDVMVALWLWVRIPRESGQ